MRSAPDAVGVIGAFTAEDNPSDHLTITVTVTQASKHPHRRKRLHANVVGSSTYHAALQRKPAMLDLIGSPVPGHDASAAKVTQAALLRDS